MLYQIFDKIVDSRLTVLHFTDGQSLHINNKGKTPYISHIGEQYMAITYDTHMTLYPFSSILNIEVW